MAELKPCPFCGGEISLKSGTQSISFIDTEWECGGCRMEFSYCQDFAYSRKAKVAINPSFVEVWNRRVEK